MMLMIKLILIANSALAGVSYWQNGIVDSSYAEIHGGGGGGGGFSGGGAGTYNGNGAGGT